MHPFMFSDTFRARLDAWNSAHPKSERHFRAEAGSGGTELEISVLGYIGYDWWTGEGVTDKEFKRALDAHPDVATIRVVINSPGGSAFDGISIRSLLQRHDANVVTEVTGLAASAASIIMMAGDEREMHVGSEMMIHEASTCACGNADALEKTMAALRSIDSGIVPVYADITGIDAKRVAKLLKAETWMNADVAFDEGFATKVLRRDAAAPKPDATEIPEQSEPEGEGMQDNAVVRPGLAAMQELTESYGLQFHQLTR